MIYLQVNLESQSVSTWMDLGPYNGGLWIEFRGDLNGVKNKLQQFRNQL